MGGLLYQYLLCQRNHRKKDEISEGSQEDINQLVGEAYLMRAYMHFILVNLYGQPYTATGALENQSSSSKAQY